MAAVVLKRCAQLALCCLLANTGQSALAAKPQTEVADLRYGVTLYHYFQKDYFQALTELYVAEQKGGITGHGDNPEIIEGGISLAFGMRNNATGLFEQLLGETHPKKVRHTAWFYLAKLAYNQGHWQQAQSAIDKLNFKELNRTLREEAQALSINILIRQNKLDKAQSALAEFPEKSHWHSYLSYNLAAAWGRDGNFDQSLAFYRTVYEEPLTEDSPEPELQLALRDRARTAAGYAAIAIKDFEQAQNTLNQVRLTDVIANEALLGSGWSAFNQEQYLQALSPWQELLRREFLYPEVQEAHLAVPFAFEQMNAPGEALLAYSDAETAYELELARIGEAEQSLYDTPLLQLLDLEAERNSSWLQTPNPQFDKVINYLHTLVGQTQFQARIQQLRELQALKQLLDNWQVKMADYQDLADARAINRVDQARSVSQLDYPSIIAGLDRRRQRIAERIKQVQDDANYLTLAKGENQDLAERAHSIKTKIARYPEELRPDQIAKAKLLHGILYWQESQNYHEHLWALQSQLSEVDKQRERLQDIWNRVQTALAEAPDLDPMNQRLANMQARLDQQQAHLQATLNSVSEELTVQMLAELELQRQRVSFFLAESRLAIARIYDQHLTGAAGESTVEQPLANEPPGDATP